MITVFYEDYDQVAVPTERVLSAGGDVAESQPRIRAEIRSAITLQKKKTLGFEN